jgi:hypothetical protein
MIELRYIDRIISCQQKSVSWRLIYASTIFSFGLLILITTYITGFSESLGIIANIGSALVISITAWPIKEIIDRKSSLRMFKELRTDIVSLQEDEYDNSLEMEKIKNIVWQAVEKLALG